MTRQDNDANVLCLGSRLKIDNVLGIVDEYLNTEFSLRRSIMMHLPASLRKKSKIMAH